MNFEGWNVRGIGGGGTDITTREMPTMPIIPRVGHKGGGLRAEGCQLWIIECVEQPELKALIGGGMAPPEKLAEVAFTPESGLPMFTPGKGRGGGPDAVLRALEQLKIKPEEIKVVVPGHLHWSCVFFLDYVPNAQVIIHRKEILAAVDPTPENRFGYPRDGINKALKRRQPDHLLIVDDDYEVWPGFRVIYTPGHTDGHQEVILQTKQGKASAWSENVTVPCVYPDDPRAIIPGIDPGPYTFMKGGYIAPQHCAGEPLEVGRSLKKMRGFLTGENDIVVPYMSTSIRAIPYQWWEFPSEECKKELAEMQAKEEYWEAGLGIFPDCYEFLKIREKRLKRMSQPTRKKWYHQAILPNFTI